MKNRTLVMLENRQGYGERLAAFVSRQTDSPFNVHLYLEHPIKEEQWEKADLILMTSSLTGLYGEKAGEDKVVILDEEGRGGEEQKNCIYKYQSAVQIYGEILRFCADSGTGFVPTGDNKGKKWTLTGIYTPVSSEKMSRKVLEFCEKLALNEKILYLNMEQITCISELIESGGRQEGISEMIYYIKQRQENLGTRLGMMVIRETFDYLLPSAIPAEIAELNGEDWQFCIEQLRYSTPYEQVILDFGTAMPPVTLLEVCDRWVVFQEGTEWEDKLMHRFISIADRMTEGVFEERVVKIGEVVS